MEKVLDTVTSPYFKKVTFDMGKHGSAKSLTLIANIKPWNEVDSIITRWALAGKPPEIVFVFWGNPTGKDDLGQLLSGCRNAPRPATVKFKYTG